MPSPDLVVQFNPELYNVSESGGTVTLLLEVDKQFEYPFTVEVNTADRTAVGEVHVHSVWIYCGSYMRVCRSRFRTMSYLEQCTWYSPVPENIELAS